MNIVWAMEGVKLPTNSGRILLLATLAYVLCRGLLLALLLPPWQGADEPGHAEMAVLVARSGWPQDTDPALQARILTNMRATRFFGWLDEDLPAASVTGFAQVPRLADAPSQVGDESPLGYLPLAVAAAAGDPAVGPLLRRLRRAALATALLWVLALYWAGSRIGGRRLGGVLAASAAFLPLGGLASATANPDLVPALWAVLWLGSLPQPGRPQRRGGGWTVLRLALVCLAALSKRSGLFLIPLALICEAGIWKRHAGGGALRPQDGTRGVRAASGRLLILVTLGALLGSLVLRRGTVATGWQGEGRPWGTVRLPAAARSGDVGFRVVDDDPQAWQYLLRWVDLPAAPRIDQEEARDAARTVHVQAWVRAASGQPPAPVQVAVSDGRGAWWGQTVKAGREWSPLQVHIVLPAGVDRLRLALVPGAGTAAGRGAFDVDDIALRVDGRDGPELPLNGGAEEAERWGATLARGLGRYLDQPRLLRGAAHALRDPAAGLPAAAHGLTFLLHSSWGGFGWLKVWPGTWATALGSGLGGFMVVAVLLALLWPSVLARGLGPEAQRWLRLCGLGALAAVLVTVTGSMLGAVDRLPQGRYLLPAYPFFAHPALALAQRLLPARGPWLLCLLLLALDQWILFGLLWPSFGGAA